MPRVSKAKQELIDGLKKKAVGWAKDIETRANATPGKPSHVVPRVRATVRGTDVTINATGLSAKGDARAYEYGSGVHSRLPNKSPWQASSRGTILITPKKGTLLAFDWDAMNNIMETFGVEAVREALQYSRKFVGFADDGRYLFKYVDHPGVEAANGGKGYLGPAITAVRAKMRREIPKEIKKVVVIDVKRSFQRTKK